MPIGTCRTLRRWGLYRPRFIAARRGVERRGAARMRRFQFFGERSELGGLQPSACRRDLGIAVEIVASRGAQPRLRLSIGAQP